MDKDNVIRSLKTQLLIERSIMAVVLLVLLGRWVWGGLASAPYAIMVDGRPVVFLESRESAEKVLSKVKLKKASAEKKVEFAQDVKIRRYRGGTPVVPVDKAVDTTSKNVNVRMEKWVITADGKQVVAVNTQAMAGNVLEELKARFGAQVPNLLEEPQFKENVKVELTDVDEDLYRRDTASAIDAILHPAPEGKKQTLKEYTVKQGDVASNIASRAGISLEKLESLNPGRDLDRLQIGDKLKIAEGAAPGKPKITVVVRDIISEVQQIPYTTQTTSSTNLYQGKQFQAQAGRNGLKRVRLAVRYENGVRAGSEVVEEEIIREAVPRRIVMGIKPR